MKSSDWEEDDPSSQLETPEWEEDDLPTRPMPLHERPLQARIDNEMAIIAQHHVRIALAIEKFGATAIVWSTCKS